MAKFIFTLKGAYINFDALDKLGINMQEYAFLESIHQWQQNSGNGWAGPGLANNYQTITIFKNKLGNRCGLSPATTARFITRMKAAGLLEEKTSRMRVTDDFRIVLGVGKREKTIDEEPPNPSVSETPNDGKTFYLDSQFVDYEAFKASVNAELPTETDLDIKHYFNEIKAYYSTENVKAYKNWDMKISNWIKRQIKDGDVWRIGASKKTTAKRTNEELLEDLRGGYKAVRSVNELTIFKQYKYTVLTYLSDANEAETRDILPASVLEDKNYYTAILKESGGLLKHIEALKQESKTPLPATNDS
jgi:DNA-binding MarR family transcriptional regulator